MFCHLTQLDNAQVAFSIKQTKPSTVDDAVRATLEMESFLVPSIQTSASQSVSHVSEESAESTEPVAAIGTGPQEDVMKLILERMD